MNTRVKGNRTRRKVADWYEEHKYRVYVVPEMRWSKDIFGVGDLLCVNKDVTKLVQVKSRQNFSWKEYEETCKEIPRGIVIELWIGDDKAFRWNPGQKRFVELQLNFE